MIRIGHASSDLDKLPGDKTGGEVTERTWYDKGWTVCLRPVNKEFAEKSAKACEEGCRHKLIGYSQNRRNTLHDQLVKTGYDFKAIKSVCDCDCSSFMTECARAADATIRGYKMVNGKENAPTTRTMRSTFTSSGAYKALTDKKYLISDKYLRRGDILVSEGKHTVMALEDGSRAYEETAPSKYYNKYNGKSTSIVEVLQMMKIDSCKQYRAKIAAANGIKDYSGTAPQNIKLLELLKQGKLIKPKS